MKFNPGLYLIIAMIAFILGFLTLLIQRKGGGIVSDPGSFKSFSYSPGYSDMNGASHYETLKKDENETWVIVTGDRDSFEEPMVTKTYEVSEDAVEEFEAFLIERNVLGLVNRKDSDEFITDYSSWGFSIVYDNSAAGGSRYETYSIGEYKRYSDKDYELIQETKDRFHNLRGRVLSETTEEDN